MPIFLPRATSWSLTPRKKPMFFNIAKMKFLAAEGLEAPQKTMFFLTPQAKYTVNYRWFGRPGVGGRAGSALPPKASGKDTRWPVAGVRI